MNSQRRGLPLGVYLVGGILLLIGLFNVLSDEYVALGGNTSFAGIKEESSIAERYPSYTPLKLQRDQFDLTPENLGEALVPLGVVGFNPWDESGTTNYNLEYEFHVDTLGFPVRFYGHTLEFDGSSFVYSVSELEPSSGAYLVLTSPGGIPTVTAFSSGAPLRTLFLWGAPLKDGHNLYVYRIEEPNGGLVDNISIASNQEGILWSVTLVGGREVVENGFHMQNVLPDTTSSSAFTALGVAEDVQLYFGTKVTVADVPFTLTAYHFTPGNAFVPTSTQEIYLLVTWEDGVVPVMHDNSVVIEGQSVIWSTKVGDSNLNLGVLHTPASVASPYYVENVQEILGITTK